VLCQQPPAFLSILANAKAESDRRTGRVRKFSQIYKKALVSKQVFSGIAKGKIPLKDTVIRFAFALENTIEDAEYLLKCAGYSFGICIKRDMLLKSCFEKGIMDILEIDEILKSENEKPFFKDKKIKGEDCKIPGLPTERLHL
jgi:hypothetical protein